MCIQDGLGLNETWPGFSLRQRKVDLQEGHAFRDSLGKRVMLSLDKDKDMYGAALHRLFRQQKRKRRSRELNCQKDATCLRRKRRHVSFNLSRQ